jgi:hypothetical protein
MSDPIVMSQYKYVDDTFYLESITSNNQNIYVCNIHEDLLSDTYQAYINQFEVPDFNNKNKILTLKGSFSYDFVVVVYNSFLYVSCNFVEITNNPANSFADISTITKYDINNLTPPIIIATFPNHISSMIVYKNYLFINREDDTIYKLDLLNDNPSTNNSIWSQKYNNFYPWFMTIIDNYMYVSSYNTISLLDITKDTNPMYKQDEIILEHGIRGLTNDGTFIYIALSNGYISKLNINDMTIINNFIFTTIDPYSLLMTIVDNTLYAISETSYIYYCTLPPKPLLKSSKPPTLDNKNTPKVNSTEANSTEVTTKFKPTMGSLFSNNAQVFYKSHTLAPGGIGGVRNYRIKSRKT